MGYNDLFGIPRYGVVPKDSDAGQIDLNITLLSITAVSSSNMLVWRQGNMLFCQGNITTTTVTTGQAGVQLPPGLNIDFQKLSTASTNWIAGKATEISSASASVTYLFPDSSASSNILYFAVNISAFGFQKLNANNVTSNGEILNLEFRVPIKEWAV